MHARVARAGGGKRLRRLDAGFLAGGVRYGKKPLGTDRANKAAPAEDPAGASGEALTTFPLPPQPNCRLCCQGKIYLRDIQG